MHAIWLAIATSTLIAVPVAAQVNESAPGAPDRVAATKTFVAVYRQGPAWRAGVPVFEQPNVKEHIVHHEALGDRLVGAGPVRAGKDDLVGYVILLAPDQASADRWFAADPAVVSGVMRGEVRQWGVSEIRPFKAMRK